MVVDPLTTAIVALGSNLGESKRIVREALKGLEILSTEAVMASSLWETEPIDCAPGTAPFINAIAIVTPRETDAPTFLKALHDLERRAGRQREGQPRNAPRELDLDLISFRQQVVDTPTLTLPHPRAHERAFVLMPLNEIAPDFVLPNQAASVRALLKEIPSLEQPVRKLS